MTLTDVELLKTKKCIPLNNNKHYLTAVKHSTLAFYLVVMIGPVRIRPKWYKFKNTV